MHLGFHFQNFIQDGFIFTLLSYGAKTIPMPTNQYARWFIGLVQFGLANSELAKKNFAGVTDGQTINEAAQSATKV